MAERFSEMENSAVPSPSLRVILRVPRIWLLANDLQLGRPMP